MPSSTPEQILAAARAIDEVLAPLTADPASAAAVMTLCAARASKRAGVAHGKWLTEVRHVAATAWDDHPNAYQQRTYDEAAREASTNGGYLTETIERLRTLAQRREDQVVKLTAEVERLRRLRSKAGDRTKHATVR